MTPSKKISLTLIICSLGFIASAQSDSVSASTYEESVQTSDYTKRERFKYLKRSMIEEPSMFKISTLPYFAGYFGMGMQAVVGYEKKFSRSFSFTGEVVNYINIFSPKTNNPELRYNGLWRSGLNVSSRYYYSQKREIEKGISGNNLLSNYIEFRVEDLLTYAKVNESTYLRNDFISRPNLVLAWGLQRRIGRYGYFDFAAGAKFVNNSLYSPFPVTPYFKIAFGLAPSKKNIRGRK